MKNILILIVFVAVYLHFYPQPEVTRWYEEKKEALLEMFSDATDTKVRLKAERVYKDLEPKLNQFRPSEIKHVQQIMSSRKAIVSYYQEYCANKRDAKLYVKNQALVCQTMSKYSSFF